MRRCARATSTPSRCRARRFDLVTIHQVLHYLDDGARAIREAARVLRPGGRLVIVDFAPHELEFLRDEHAHLRLGFADRQIARLVEGGRPRRRAHRTSSREPAADGKIAVKLWLGRDRRIAHCQPPRARSRMMGDRLMNQFRFSRRPDIGDKIRVSFEFFPPKTDEMEARLWETVTRLAPLQPELRLGHLRRRRLDARAHRPHRQAHPRRDRR